MPKDSAPYRLRHRRPHFELINLELLVLLPI
jgi:hypothetical protein